VNDSNQHRETEPPIEMRIVRLDNEKTCRVEGSELLYDIYFEMLGSPPQAWGILYAGEWKLLNAEHLDLWQAARVERNCLVMRCPLNQVVSLHLRFLKKAPVLTNVKYAQYASVIAKERSEERLAWERERRNAEAIAKLVVL